MANEHFLRGMATVNYFADDLAADRDWYTELFGIEAYFQMPSHEKPAYIEFRIGDDAGEFGIIDRRYAPGHEAGLGRSHPLLARRRYRKRPVSPEVIGRNRT